jgi:hypothetical protein
MKTPMKRKLIGENMPFIIRIQNHFQFQMMLEHKHESALSPDATFGTNQEKIQSCTFLAFPFLLTRSLLCFLFLLRTSQDTPNVSCSS